MAVVIGCVSVLLGVLAGQRPDIILWRSLISGVVIGGLSRFLEQLLEQQFTEPTDDGDDANC